MEASYAKPIIDTLKDKLEHNVQISSIFSDSTTVTKDRKKNLKKTDLSRFIQDKTLARRMKKDISVALILNEREAAVSFPNASGEVDLSKMFYSDNPEFHDWCLDYFNHTWNASGAFHEDKLQT